MNNTVWYRLQKYCIQNHRTIEWIRLRKIFKIIEDKHQSSSAKSTTKPYPCHTFMYFKSLGIFGGFSSMGICRQMLHDLLGTVLTCCLCRMSQNTRPLLVSTCLATATLHSAPGFVHRRSCQQSKNVPGVWICDVEKKDLHLYFFPFSFMKMNV